MIDYKYKDFYNDTSVSKRMQIQCSDGSVLNEDDWKGESAELTERLCSESELSFGRCEASTSAPSNSTSCRKKDNRIRNIGRSRRGSFYDGSL